MGEVQIYNPVDGFSRMVSDMEHTLTPILNKIEPILKGLSSINRYLIIGLFLVLLWYMLFVRHHSVMEKLKTPTNYFAAIIFLGIYLFLTDASLRFGKDSLGQEMKLSLDFIVMPMSVKLLGPVVGCFFGMIQYGASFLVRDEIFNLEFMLVAGISAMIYGRFLYKRRTGYIRCFTTKLLVNLVCNVLLIPFYSLWSPEFVVSAITNQLVFQIVLTPIQALAIYISLIVFRKIRKILSEVSWSL